MGINWIKVEDELPVDNGRVQKFLVCINQNTSSFENCNIDVCYFTDRFRTECIPMFHKGLKITHWAKITKPEDLEE